MQVLGSESVPAANYESKCKAAATKLKKALKSMNPDDLEKVLREMTKEELREALKNMTKEEIRALKKAGKLKDIEGIEDLLDTDSSNADSDSESDGKGKKKKKKRLDSAFSYYSVTSEGGTRYVRKKRRRADGTYSDSESCASAEEAIYKKEAASEKGRRKSKKGGKGEGKEKKGKKGEKDSDGTTKKGKKKGGKGQGGESDVEGGGKGKKGKKGKGEAGGAEADDEDSDCSLRSEVSEGGTRRMVKMKRIRDADGNIIGYGDPMPADVRAASVAGRRGSLDSRLSLQELTEEERVRREHLQEVEEQIKQEEEKRQAEEQERQKKEKYEQEKKRALEERKQLRENERAARGSKGAMSQDGVLLVQGKGMNDEEGDADGTGPGGKKPDDVPSDFSDDDSLSDIENKDFSKMTEEEKQAYLADREKRQKALEDKRRARYGDKYDDIMKKKKEKKESDKDRKKGDEKTAEEEEEEEKKRQEALKQQEEERKRRLSLASKAAKEKAKEKPKSMVTYDKGPPRWPQEKERSDLNRDVNQVGYDRRNSRAMTSESGRRHSRGGTEDGEGKYPKLPPIKGKRGSISSEDGENKRRGRKMHPRGEIIDRNVAKAIAEKRKQEEEEGTYPDDDIIEFDEEGKLRLRRGKKLDLSKMSDEMLRKLGIDPSLSNKEKAKLLKKLFGSDIMITENGNVIGTKAIDEYDLQEITDEMLAEDPDLDIDTLTGQRRVNVLFRKGGLLLKEHMKKIMATSNLMEDSASYRTDLDEKGDIDFMRHYRLVNPDLLEGYAKAFVVEDGDMDTVISLKEALTALDGVPSIQHMTSKQFDYVFKVLNIDDATQVTFRMFAVITALCERVTCMDDLSKHLLEICNLADIERKLDLYRSMFYHNVQSGLDPNNITADSLKIELIAGGLSWLQQQYVMEKMDISAASEISFLDYMCYIPLFLSMHDNIVDNPLDMSDQKYSMPPRTRPISAQRDINPLGFPLSKSSSLQMRKQAKDLMEGRLKPTDVEASKAEQLYKYAKLPDIKPVRRGNSAATTVTSTSDVEKLDLIF